MSISFGRAAFKRQISYFYSFLGSQCSLAPGVRLHSAHPFGEQQSLGLVVSSVNWEEMKPGWAAPSQLTVLARQAACTTWLVPGCATEYPCWGASSEWEGTCLGTDVWMQCALLSLAPLPHPSCSSAAVRLCPCPFPKHEPHRRWNPGGTGTDTQQSCFSPPQSFDVAGGSHPQLPQLATLPAHSVRGWRLSSWPFHCQLSGSSRTCARAN